MPNSKGRASTTPEQSVKGASQQENIKEASRLDAHSTRPYVAKSQATLTRAACHTQGDTPYASMSEGALSEIKQIAQELGFEEIYFLRASEIVIARWVGLKCQYGCTNYGTNWCCPPASPDLEAMRELVSEYTIATLLIRRHKNDQFYRNSAEKRRLQVQQWKAVVTLERKLFLNGYYKAFGFPPETCALCKKCAYPGRCKFPNEKRPALEACGIDVFQTIKRIGKSFEPATNVHDTYNSYSLILLA
ncbi:MAG: DUF2284 domain-containing protein [Desulfomonilaceae bacterium]